jgi:diadenosine tetraphosphate (Ap4A) HIT family hydrolase
MLDTKLTIQTSSCDDVEVQANFVTGCLFCELPEEKFEVIEENDLCMTLRDSYPVTEGHCLIIPRRHVDNYFDMNHQEISAATDLMHRARERLQAEDATISGFNIGTNAGKSAGQSVFHAHIHFMPRRDGDQENPQGGVRKIFPEKARYRR